MSIADFQNVDDPCSDSYVQSVEFVQHSPRYFSPHDKHLGEKSCFCRQLSLKIKINVNNSESASVKAYPIVEFIR